MLYVAKGSTTVNGTGTYAAAAYDMTGKKTVLTCTTAGVAVDSSGNVCVANTNGSIIQKIVASVATIAPSTTPETESVKIIFGIGKTDYRAIGHKAQYQHRLAPELL